jgi:hypothetical protein
MTPQQVIAEVSPLIGSRWGYEADYELFVGPKCPECGARACRSPACLAAIRAAVAGTQTVREVARVLGVTGKERAP